MIEDFGDVGSWAELTLFPPWIEDGDGTLINEAFLQARNDAGHGQPHADRLAPSLSFHSASNSAGGAG